MAALPALFAVSFTMLCIVGGIVGLCRLIARLQDNARCAALYRAGQQATVVNPNVPSYTLIYKSGKATQSAHIVANTEGEAMAIALKNNIRYDKIISLTRN